MTNTEWMNKTLLAKEPSELTYVEIRSSIYADYRSMLVLRFIDSLAFEGGIVVAGAQIRPHWLWLHSSISPS